MTAVEWVPFTSEQAEADQTLEEAVERFRAPDVPAGDAASQWLRDTALKAAGGVATFLAIHDRELAAFYSLRAGELELSTGHSRSVGSAHPISGAVLIPWLAKAGEDGVEGEMILSHAVGTARKGARHIGAAIIALDPYDAGADELWRERFEFLSSRTKFRDANGEERKRLWRPLFQ